jgi:hypothetical protein
MAKTLNITLICVSCIFILLGAAGYFWQMPLPDAPSNTIWLITIRTLAGFCVGLTLALILFVINYCINSTFDKAIAPAYFFIITLVASLCSSIIGSVYYFWELI